MSRKILKANKNTISHVRVGDCKIITDIVLITFNSDGVFRAPWFERGTRRFLRHDIYDEPSVDWLATIGVPHSQAAPVTKFTGYLTRSKKIQWNFQRSSGYWVVFFIVFTVLLLLLLLFYFLPYACFAAFVFFSKILFFIRVHASETVLIIRRRCRHRLSWIHREYTILSVCFNVGGYRLFPDTRTFDKTTVLSLGAPNKRPIFSFVVLCRTDCTSSPNNKVADGRRSAHASMSIRRYGRPATFSAKISWAHCTFHSIYRRSH